MNAEGFISALFVGLVIGALGRLVVPGRQPIGCLLTVAVGIIGAIGGTALANWADVDAWLLVVACQVGIAAGCVALIGAAMTRPRRRRPPPR